MNGRIIKAVQKSDKRDDKYGSTNDLRRTFRKMPLRDSAKPDLRQVGDLDFALFAGRTATLQRAIEEDAEDDPRNAVGSAKELRRKRTDTARAV